MTKPQDTRHLVVFRPTTSALERQRQLDSERVYIFTQPPALCDDIAAQTLLAQLIKKYAENAKWQIAWDEMSEAHRIEHANQGKQRKGGRKSSEPYDYLKDRTPLYEPVFNPLIEMHCADFLEFASVRCKLPLDFWLTETARANRNIVASPLPERERQGDFRIMMTLMITRAMHNKTYCSFIPYIKAPKDDTYYFPDGIAFTNAQKSSTVAAAEVLFRNPNAYLPANMIVKATNWNNNMMMLCDVQQPSGLLAGVEAMAKTKAKAKAKPSSSSSTKPADSEVKKRPAVHR
jgi:hypothetical protein